MAFTPTAEGAREKAQSAITRVLRNCCEADQFDAYVWFETTRAVTALPAGRPQGARETCPFGL